MIVDTSAVLAVLFDEPDAEHYVRALAGASRCRMSAVSFLEAAIVLESRAGAAAGPNLDLLLERAPIELEPVTLEHAQAARRAWRRFGRGNHQAGTQLRRLLRLCVGRIHPRTPSVQRPGFRTYGHRARHSVIGRLTEST